MYVHTYPVCREKDGNFARVKMDANWQRVLMFKSCSQRHHVFLATFALLATFARRKSAQSQYTDSRACTQCPSAAVAVRLEMRAGRQQNCQAVRRLQTLTPADAAESTQQMKGVAQIQAGHTISSRPQ